MTAIRQNTVGISDEMISKCHLCDQKVVRPLYVNPTPGSKYLELLKEYGIEPRSHTCGICGKIVCGSCKMSVNAYDGTQTLEACDSCYPKVSKLVGRYYKKQSQFLKIQNDCNSLYRKLQKKLWHSDDLRDDRNLLALREKFNKGN